MIHLPKRNADLKNTGKTLLNSLNSTRISGDLFAISRENAKSTIIYAPLRQKLALLNCSLTELSSNVDLQNLANDKLGENCPDPEVENLEIPFKPTRITILPTLDCNLRCIYCYSSGGDRKTRLPLTIALKAVDFAIQNCIEKEESKFHVGFLGGGEPFLCWELVEEVVRYAREKADSASLEATFSGVTNGILDKHQIHWLAENFHHINISVDGYASIQDNQRPMLDGSPSSPRVFQSIRSLNDLGVKNTLRVTVSNTSVRMMPEILHFFHEELGANRVLFEPLFQCGRCAHDRSISPDPNEFVLRFCECIDLGNHNNIEVRTGAVQLDVLHTHNCEAGCTNFFLTPSGNITACTEVSEPSDSMSELFFIGSFRHKENRFVFDDERRKSLHSRNTNNLQGCTSCFLKWHCAGGCMVKASRLSDGNLFSNKGSESCEKSQAIAFHLLDLLSQGIKPTGVGMDPVLIEK